LYKLLHYLKITINFLMDKNNLILGIDASNIRDGGGLTHLVEIIRASKPSEYSFSKVFIWSGDSTLQEFDNHPWLEKRSNKFLNGNFVTRIFWQKFCLKRTITEAKCDVLFIPGGSFSIKFPAIVTISQNMLPFELKELLRFGASLMTFKFFLLRISQATSFKKANGVIFLTNYAKNKVTERIGNIAGKISIIPHGINANFFNNPHEQKPMSYYTISNPFKILYISRIDMYKHQNKVAEAVSLLRNEGFPVSLELVGSSYSPALKKLNMTLKKFDHDNEYIHYSGSVKHYKLHDILKRSDLFLFASTCENMPNILLEGMASGLPIACSSYGPMPEILEDSGVYFDPEKSQDIALSVKKLLISHQLREKMSKQSYEKAKEFSWDRCSSETFNFLKKIAIESNLNKVIK